MTTTTTLAFTGWMKGKDFGYALTQLKASPATYDGDTKTWTLVADDGGRWDDYLTLGRLHRYVTAGQITVTETVA